MTTLLCLILLLRGASASLYGLPTRPPLLRPNRPIHAVVWRDGLGGIPTARSAASLSSNFPSGGGGAAVSDSGASNAKYIAQREDEGEEAASREDDGADVVGPVFDTPPGSRFVGRGGATKETHIEEDGDVAEEHPAEDAESIVPSGRKAKRRRKKEEEQPTSAAQYAKKLKNRNRMNIKRKILHCTFGLFFAGLHHVIPRNRFVPGMAILTSATLLMELLRYRKGFGWMNDALHFVLGSQLRKHEMEGKFTGSFYYFFGVTMTAWLFPPSAASLGIAQLAIADPSASYFGRQTRHIYWSRIEGGLGGVGRNKGILGFLGGALFCFPYNYRVLSVAKWSAAGIPGGRSSLLLASFSLGVAGAFADLAVPTPAVTMPSKICGLRVPPFHIDDNFVVPIFSGYACTKIFDLLGWPRELELAKYILF